MIIKEHNIETGEVVERAATKDELAQIELDQLESKKVADLAKEKAEHKAALLVKLGITEDEAKLLLG